MAYQFVSYRGYSQYRDIISWQNLCIATSLLSTYPMIKPDNSVPVLAAMQVVVHFFHFVFVSVHFTNSLKTFHTTVNAALEVYVSLHLGENIV